MRPVTLAITVLAINLLGGCKGGSPFVGKWNSETVAMGFPMATVTVNNADGTFKSVSTVKRSGNAATFVATDTGTWKLDGDRLTIVIKDVEWKAVGASAEVAKRVADRFNANKAQVIQQANATPAKTIKWNGNDEFSFSENGKTFTYRRAK